MVQGRLQRVVGKAMHRESRRVHAVVERKPVTPWSGGYPVKLLCGCHYNEDNVVTDEMDPLVRLAEIDCVACSRRLIGRTPPTDTEGGE